MSVIDKFVTFISSEFMYINIFIVYCRSDIYVLSQKYEW